ncbi:MAG TPA: YceI family protein [Rhizomicrobium sp.]|nr:YceI family protein [Rhizomicrobium sp.]
MKHIAAFLLAMCITANAQTAQAADWVVDHTKSQLGFSVQWQDRPFTGLFRNWDAQITFDPQNLDHAKAVVKVDIASVTSGSDEMDQGLKSAEGFDAPVYSTAIFETTWFRATGKNTYEARGNLTLHGITRAISLPFKLQIKDNIASMRGTAAVTRTDFRVGMGQWASEYPVAHQVNVIVDLVAKKAK